MQTRTTTSRITKVITLSLSTLMGALLHVQAAQTAVYLKAGATGQADGTSWADAYTDAASAIAAAATAGLPIYAAGGVYIISATITPSASIAIYGGFAGLSDDETPDDRDTDLYQTIFTGDKTLDDKWVHVEPRLGQYGVTSTTLTNTVIQNGRVVLPPAFTADYDVYYGTISGNNTSQGFSISSGVAVTFDGLWFTGFTSSGSVGSVLTLDSGAGAFVMNDCRLTACRGGTRAAIFLGNSAAARITNSRFFCTTSVEGGAFRSGNANLIVSNCLFTSFYRSGQNTSGNVFYAQTDNELRDCEFSRCFDITSQAGGAWGGMGNLNGGDGGNPRFINCVITNNLSITSGQYGNPLIPRATLIKGCLFANNRYETKPFDGRGYALVGYAYASVSWHMLCEGCVFRDNVVTAPASTTTAGAYYLGILGQNVVGNGSGQSFDVVNCVFDSNVASATHAPLTGVAPHLCRGTYVLGTITGSKPQIGVANCTFTGSLLDGVYDIAQWGENYAQDITVVNSTFSVNDAEIASNWLYADVPGRVKAYSCSVKNLPAVPENFAVCANLETDDIPLDADYRPLARTPGIRTTAEVSTNVASAAASTFAYLPNGAEIWVALLPVVSATITSTNSPIGDLFGATRPYGAFTRGATQPPRRASRSLSGARHSLRVRSRARRTRSPSPSVRQPHRSRRYRQTRAWNLMAGSNGFIYDVVAAQPLFVEALQRDAAGLPARRLASSSPGPYGRKVWLKGGDIYFHDDIANAAKPWRKVIDKGFFAASVEGLDITSPCIPDAFGIPRSRSRVAPGPLNVSWGMMMLVR